MEIEKLANIEITDEDILWVEEMMGGKVHFDSASVNVLKNMDSVDIPVSYTHLDVYKRQPLSCPKNGK